jgi:hypothetical protein
VCVCVETFIRRDISVSMVTGWRTRLESRRGRKYSLRHPTRPGLVSTYFPIQRVPKALFSWSKRDAITHLHVVPTLRMREAILHSRVGFHGLVLDEAREQIRCYVSEINMRWRRHNRCLQTEEKNGGPFQGHTSDWIQGREVGIMRTNSFLACQSVF